MSDDLKKDIGNKEKDFFDYLRFEKLLSKNTIDSYRQDIAKLKDHIELKKIDPFKITKEEILGLLEDLYRNNNEATVSRFLSAMRTFYRFMLREEAIDKNPFEKVKNPKKPKNILKTLSEQEVQRYLESIPTSTDLQLRDRTMLELLYSSGLRVSELTDLKLSDIDLEEETLRFIGKGGKERLTLIGGTAATFLKKYLKTARYKIEKEKKSEFLFLNIRGGKISRQGCWKVIKKYAKRLGMEDDVYPHIFRHSFATHMLKKGADLRVVQELLGHSSINTTEIYTNIDKQHIKEIYFRYHPRQAR